jgi:hypothetical protein
MGCRLLVAKDLNRIVRREAYGLKSKQLYYGHPGHFWSGVRFLFASHASNNGHNASKLSTPTSRLSGSFCLHTDSFLYLRDLMPDSPTASDRRPDHSSFQFRWLSDQWSADQDHRSKLEL